MTLFKEKFMFSDAFTDAYRRLDKVTLFKEKLMYCDAFADTGDGNLCGCWPLSSSSRAPSEEDIPAQVRILGILRQTLIW